MEMYVTLKLESIFGLTIFKIEDNVLYVLIAKNVYFRMPLTQQWKDYINITCLQIYPKIGNITKIPSMLINRYRLEEPIQEPFVYNEIEDREI